MAISLQDLIGNLPGQLSGEILSPEQKQAQVEAQVSASMPEMLRRYGQTAQQQNEAAFGKGMGLSTYNAYQQALNSLLQSEAAGQIRQNAQAATDAAQRAAIGNAANYATGEQNRQAQASQARAGRQQATTLQNRNMLYGGLGSLASGVIGTGARDLTRPSGTQSQVGNAKDRMLAALGLGGSKGEAATEAYPSLNQPEGTAPTAPNTDAFESNYPSQSSYDFGDQGGFNSNVPSFDTSFDYGSSFNPPEMDLWSLINGTYNQSDLGF